MASRARGAPVVTGFRSGGQDHMRNFGRDARVELRQAWLPMMRPPSSPYSAGGVEVAVMTRDPMFPYPLALLSRRRARVDHRVHPRLSIAQG